MQPAIVNGRTLVPLRAIGELKRDIALEETAKIRAKEIVQKFDHERPDGTSCFTAYPSGLSTMGENIACTGNNDQTQLFLMFAETEEDYAGQGHRRNMLNDNFTKVGIAVYRINGVSYCCMAFGR